MSDLIKALQIFLKYGDQRNPTHCEHDTLRVCIEDSLVSEEDKIELEKLGFMVDSSCGGFYSFRYGSA